MPPFAWVIPQFLRSERGAHDPTISTTFRILSDQPGPFTLRLLGEGSVTDHAVDSLTPTSFGTRTLYSAALVCGGQCADSIYDAELRVRGSSWVFDRARVRTWPTDLGGEDAPFRLFVGSCFSAQSSTGNGNDVKGLCQLLSAKLNMPHLKLFCGDQVYLDTPVRENIPHEEAAIHGFILDKYLANWGAFTTYSSRFGSLLRTGSSAFLSDDHEFWNNFPNTAIYAPSLFRIADGKKRARWFEAGARKALGLFQAVPPLWSAVQLGTGQTRLTLVTLDGRAARTDRQAHGAAALAELVRTLATCPGPAIVVLSQPLFDRPHRGGFKRWVAENISDLGLADFDDYRIVVEAIAACPHDVCILSGDIHGGRVLSTTAARGQTVHEVVSSPLSLVGPSKKFSGGDTPAGEYPELEGVHPKYGKLRAYTPPVRDNHGALLSFSRRGADFAVSVRYLQSDSGHDLTTPVTFILRSQP